MLLFTLCAARSYSLVSLLTCFFFRDFFSTFDAYLRVNCISFSNVLCFSLRFSVAIMPSVFSQQFPVKMLKSWKVHCSQMQATHSWQRDSQADRQTDSQIERQTDQTDWLTDQKKQQLWRKNIAFATPLGQDMPSYGKKPLNWWRHMDETGSDTARRECGRCRRHNDNPVELSRTCHVWRMHFKGGIFIFSWGKCQITVLM